MKRLLERLYKWDEHQNQNLMFLNFALICVHLWLEFLYWVAGSVPLVSLNIFSIMIYANLFATLHQREYLRYGKFVYGETLLQAVFATLFLGWESGFQLWLIGAVACYYFPHFISEENRDGRWMDSGSAVFSGMFSGLLYLLLYSIRNTDDCLSLSKDVPEWAQTYTYYMNIILVTAFLIFYTTIVLYRLRRNQEDLKKNARHDPLTKLYNRHALQGLIDCARDKADHLSWDFVVAIADIDFFKEVNDTYGHEAGDHVLQTISDVILSKLDEDFTYAGRWGGEEFLFIVEGSEDQVVEKLEDFRNTVENLHIWHDDKQIGVTISIGGARYSPGDDFDKILNRADRNLYTVKNNGRNAVRV